MGVIDVSTPGYALDIVASNLLFDRDTLSAAMRSLEWNLNQEEELIHLQGLQDAQARTKGHRTYSGSCEWPMKQWMLFVQKQGGPDAVGSREYTMEAQGTPDGDTALYQVSMKRFRFLNVGVNIDKSASMAKLTFSFLSVDYDVVSD